jgi:hypothetical protein
MSNEDISKKRRTYPVYSNTYSNSGKINNHKSKINRHNITFKHNYKKNYSPIPNIDLDTPEEYKKDLKKYINTVKERLSVPKGKKIDLDVEINTNNCCSKPEKYKNIISNNLQFYVCKNCGADLGDC